MTTVPDTVPGTGITTAWGDAVCAAVAELQGTAPGVTTPATSGPALWIPFPYAANWVAFDATTYFGLRVRNIGDETEMFGVLKRSGTTSAAGATIGTLAAGYRPARQFIMQVPSGTTGTTVRRIDILTNGVVQDVIGGTVVNELLAFYHRFPRS